MSLNYPSIIGAAGAVTGATGVAIWAAGAATARTGKGIYTLTLDEPADAAACAVLCSVRGATLATLEVVQTSDSVKTVTARNIAAAVQDTDFDFVVLRAPLS